MLARQPDSLANSLGWNAALNIEGLTLRTKQDYFPFHQVLDLARMLVRYALPRSRCDVHIEAWRCPDPDQEWRLPVAGFDSRSTERTKLWSNVLAFAYQHKLKLTHVPLLLVS